MLVGRLVDEILEMTSKRSGHPTTAANTPSTNTNAATTPPSATAPSPTMAAPSMSAMPSVFEAPVNPVVRELSQEEKQAQLDADQKREEASRVNIEKCTENDCLMTFVFPDLLSA